MTYFYTYTDDRAILKWILDSKREQEIMGNRLWQDLAKTGILKDRSFQSLKNRFRRVILTGLTRPEYQLPKEQRKRFYNVLNTRKLERSQRREKKGKKRHRNEDTSSDEDCKKNGNKEDHKKTNTEDQGDKAGSDESDKEAYEAGDSPDLDSTLVNTSPKISTRSIDKGEEGNNEGDEETDEEYDKSKADSTHFKAIPKPSTVGWSSPNKHSSSRYNWKVNNEASTTQNDDSITKTLLKGDINKDKRAGSKFRIRGISKTGFKTDDRFFSLDMNWSDSDDTE